MIDIAVDTNAIRGAGWRSAALASLLTLSAAGFVRLHFPSVVYDELRTQWREPLSKRLNQIKSGFSGLQADPLLTKDIKAKLAEIAAQLESFEDHDKLSQEVFTATFENHGLQVVPATFDDTYNAMRGYFLGSPPFGSVKARQDIPDGMIFEAFKRLKVEFPELLVVGADGRMREALEAEGFGAIFADVDSLLGSELLKAARVAHEEQTKWAQAKESLPKELIEEEIKEFIARNAGRFVSFRTVSSNFIPSDDHEALITSYGEPEDVALEEWEEWGNGWLTIPVAFNINAYIDFSVYRGDAYSLPDWVSVSFGDPEEDHYFEAQGDVELHVQLELTALVDIRDDYEDGEAVLKSVEINGRPEILLLEDLD